MVWVSGAIPGFSLDGTVGVYRHPPMLNFLGTLGADHRSHSPRETTGVNVMKGVFLQVAHMEEARVSGAG